MASYPIIVWFRQDLRLADNPALSFAAAHGPVLAVYILDEKAAGKWAMGAASRWWLKKSLASLSADLAKLKVPFIIRKGDAASELVKLAKEIDAKYVAYNQRFEPWAIMQEKAVEKVFANSKVVNRSFNNCLLFKPTEIHKSDGAPFKIYTPFSKECMKAIEEIPPPLPRPPKIEGFVCHPEGAKAIEESSDVMESFAYAQDDNGTEKFHWQPGEKMAIGKLKDFLENKLTNYEKNREFPSIDATSLLSPHLAFGEIGPRQILHALQVTSLGLNRDSHRFLQEIIWREFAYHTLYHFPHVTEKPLKTKFAKLKWQRKKEYFEAWKNGETGYPLVDAGMRQLMQTGWIHNRVRMVVGSFLVKHLWQPWTDGEEWFWEKLVDADLASNSLNWQWVTGCGHDAMPFFRVFNPIIQSKKFDKDGTYIRRFVPELTKLPAKWIHTPWLAPEEVLRSAGIALGKTYPRPIVDHEEARGRVLQTFKKISVRKKSHT